MVVKVVLFDMATVVLGAMECDDVGESWKRLQTHSHWRSLLARLTGTRYIRRAILVIWVI